MRPQATRYTTTSLSRRAVRAHSHVHPPTAWLPRTPPAAPARRPPPARPAAARRDVPEIGLRPRHHLGAGPARTDLEGPRHEGVRPRLRMLDKHACKCWRGPPRAAAESGGHDFAPVSVALKHSKGELKDEIPNPRDLAAALLQGRHRSQQHSAQASRPASRCARRLYALRGAALGRQPVGRCGAVRGAQACAALRLRALRPWPRPPDAHARRSSVRPSTVRTDLRDDVLVDDHCSLQRVHVELQPLRHRHRHPVGGRSEGCVFGADERRHRPKQRVLELLAEELVRS